LDRPLIPRLLLEPTERIYPSKPGSTAVVSRPPTRPRKP
jgi:hypothetical protein